jgi:hypothetical protein
MSPHLQYRPGTVPGLRIGFRNRYTDQWNKIESLEVNPHIHNQLTFDNEAKNKYQYLLNSVVNKWCWENLVANAEKLN